MPLAAPLSFGRDHAFDAAARFLAAAIMSGNPSNPLTSILSVNNFRWARQLQRSLGAWSRASGSGSKAGAERDISAGSVFQGAE